MRLVGWDYQISTLYLSLIRLSSHRQINTYFLENKQIRLQRFTNTNWRLASYLCWLSPFNGPKYIIIHENNNAGVPRQNFLRTLTWPLLSVRALGIILMSSAAPSNQKMCPPIPVRCQDVSLDMIDMSPANCHACHFKYF